jgi:hypothetical protein
MRCGIYAEMQTPLDKPHADLTREIMRQIEHADAGGFDTYYGGLLKNNRIGRKTF